MNIRHATPADLDAIAAVEAECFPAAECANIIVARSARHYRQLCVAVQRNTTGGLLERAVASASIESYGIALSALFCGNTRRRTDRIG